jgi:hypothetical protein
VADPASREGRVRGYFILNRLPPDPALPPQLAPLCMRTPPDLPSTNPLGIRNKRMGHAQPQGRGVAPGEARGQLVIGRESRGVLATQLVADRADFSVGLLGLCRFTVLEVLESEVQMGGGVARV